MLIVHHLQRSQSERIVWLCEELELPYELKIYQRDSSRLPSSRPCEKKLSEFITTHITTKLIVRRHPCGTAPLMEDGVVKFSESSAIMEYIVQSTTRGPRCSTCSPTSPALRTLSTGTTTVSARCSRPRGAFCLPLRGRRKPLPPASRRPPEGGTDTRAYKRMVEKAELGEERGVFPTTMKEAPKFFNAP
ncbi:putative Alpha-1,6-mannosyltransferase subunit (Hoc1) [Mycena venus]|uniref:Putative Alpha-1,6-mannosyltransferase subunit (Hoc1) n=1 Tax=Mycena venus TaxID=2733690 RepID=A0A8H6X9V9_9AGAR|nr:putative Alpha-1,6-mannosyltransferase subunit (Hoc1) [Mycena venus]